MSKHNPNQPDHDPKPLPLDAIEHRNDDHGNPVVLMPQGTWECDLTMAEVVESALGKPLTGGPLTVIGDAFLIGG